MRTIPVEIYVGSTVSLAFFLYARSCLCCTITILLVCTQEAAFGHNNNIKRTLISKVLKSSQINFLIVRDDKSRWCKITCSGLFK